MDTEQKLSFYGGNQRHSNNNSNNKCYENINKNDQSLLGIPLVATGSVSKNNSFNAM